MGFSSGVNRRNLIIFIIIIVVLLGIFGYFYLRDESILDSPSLSPGDCIPSAEKCDNIDNDCDGDVDGEVLGNYTCGVGACKRSDLLCIRGVIRQCIPGKPSPERCGDRIDNDCDGSTDELGCL